MRVLGCRWRREQGSGRHLIVAAGVAALLAAGCGDAPAPVRSKDASDRSDQQRAGFELRDPARRRLARPIFNPVVAASASQVLVAGDYEPDGKNALRVSRSAVLVDLDTGDQRQIDAPRADVPIALFAAAATPDGFVVLGTRCRPLSQSTLAGDATPEEEPDCTPGTAASFRLTADGTWQELAMPEGLGSGDDDTSWQVGGDLISMPDGSLAAHVLAHRIGAPEETFVLRLDDHGGWTAVSEISGQGFEQSCGSGADAYLLRRPYRTATATGTDQSGLGGLDADLELLRVPLAGGAPSGVPLPEVDRSIGAISVKLGCDQDHVYLTSSSPTPGSSMRLFRLGDGGDWSELAFPAGSQALPERIVSAREGILVQTTERNGTVRHRVIRMVGSDGKIRQLDDAATASVIVAQLGGAAVITMGPFDRLDDSPVDAAPNQVRAFVRVEALD